MQGGAELSVKVRLGEPELVQEAASRALGLRVFRERRAALTYTSDLSDAALDRFVAESVELAKLAEPDELNELPPRDQLATSQPDLQLWDEAALVGRRQGRARALQDGRSGGARVLAEGDELRRRHVRRASSAPAPSPTRTASPAAIAAPISRSSSSRSATTPTARSATASGGPPIASRHARDPEAVGREAARRTVAKLGSEKIATGEMPVVFDPESGRALLRALFSVISGGAIYRKSSYLLDREGTSVASPLVTIVDDPLIPRGPGSRPYDGDGLPSRKNVVVDAGILEDLSARRLLGAQARTRSPTAAPAAASAARRTSTTSNFILQKGTTNAGRDRRRRRARPLRDRDDGLRLQRRHRRLLARRGRLPHRERQARPPGQRDHHLAPTSTTCGSGIDAVGDDLDLRSSTACPTLPRRQDDDRRAGRIHREIKRSGGRYLLIS